MPLPFRELADWISAHYGVHVLNILLDTVEPDDRPRLNVVLEWTEDERKFRQGPFLSFDATRQREIGDRLAASTDEALGRKSDMGRLVVIFSAFEPIARAEANQRVTEADIEQLTKTLADRDLWKIRKGFGTVTFFLYTDAQVKARETSGARARFARAYAQIVAPYDEFGYVAKRGITVGLDSKENFDSVYRGSWFYYDKDH